MKTRRNTLMLHRRALVVLAAASMALVPLGSAGARASDSVAGSPTPPEAGYHPHPTLVTPRPGMDNVHPIGWDSVQQRGPRSLRVLFTSGVAPCFVLDHIQVDYRRHQIVVTLFEGSDPKARDQACIDIAEYKATDVKLAQRVRGRRIVDGARNARPEPQPLDDRDTLPPR